MGIEVRRVSRLIFDELIRSRISGNSANMCRSLAVDVMSSFAVSDESFVYVGDGCSELMMMLRLKTRRIA